MHMPSVSLPQTQTGRAIYKSVNASDAPNWRKGFGNRCECEASLRKRSDDSVLYVSEPGKAQGLAKTRYRRFPQDSFCREFEQQVRACMQIRMQTGQACRTLSTGCEADTQPKIPPWALIMARPASWNSGK